MPPRIMTPLVLSLLLLPLPVWAAPPTAYTLTDLGPALAPTMAPTGGLIAGSQLLPEQTAVVLAPTPTIIGTLPQGTFSLANGATTDAVCGYSGTGAFSLHTHAFRWTAAGGIVFQGSALQDGRDRPIALSADGRVLAGTVGPGTDFCEVADDGRMSLITVWPGSDDFPVPYPRA